MSFKKYVLAVICSITVSAISSNLLAQTPVDGTWISTATGDWTDPLNWLDGHIAGESGSRAHFETIDVPSGGIMVHLNSTPTIGRLYFGDTNPSTAGGWTIDDQTYGWLNLAINGATPVISVDSLGGTSVVEFNAPVYSTGGLGLTKLGNGPLILSKQSSYAITGPISLDAGMLKITGVDDPFDWTSSLTVSGTLDLDGHSQTTSAVITNADTGVVTSGIVLNGTVQNATLVNIGIHPTTSLGMPFDARSGTVSANLTENLAYGLSVGLTKTTGGTLTLSGTNSYTGGTIINDGALIFDNVNSVPTTGTITANAGMVRFNAPGLVLPAASVILNSTVGAENTAAGTLAATGPYTTLAGWLGSGKIASGATGSIALTGNSSESVNMGSYTGYGSLGLGAVGNVTYTGTLTPAANTYYLGGGGGILTIPGTNALINNGATPRDVIIKGNGTVELSGSNNYTGGTTLAGGLLKIGNINSIGGSSTALNFNGGLLEVDSSSLSIDSNAVNWSTFNGGFVVDEGVTFNLNHTISGGTNLHKGGAGTLNLAGTCSYTVSQGIIVDSGTVYVAPGATVNAALTMDFFNGGGSGHIIIGTPGTSATTALQVTGGNASLWTGHINFGGGYGGNSTVDIYGTNTTVGTLLGENLVSVGGWGTSTAVVNLYDSVLLKTRHLKVGAYHNTNATINMYNNSKLDLSGLGGDCHIAYYLNPSDPNAGGAMNMYDSSKTKIRADFYVGGMGNAALNMTGTSSSSRTTLIAGGVLYASAWAYWDGIYTIGNTSQINIGQNASLAANGIRLAGADAFDSPSVSTMNLTGDAKVYVGAVTNDTNWNITGQTSYATVTLTAGSYNSATININALDNGSAVMTAGAMNIGDGYSYNEQEANGEVNIGGHGTLTLNGTLTLGVGGGARGVLNATGNSTVTANAIIISAGGYGGERYISVSENANVKTTGDLTLGNISWPMLISNSSIPVEVDGNVYLNGGRIECSGIKTTAVAGGLKVPTGTITFNGGAIFSTAANTSFMSGISNVYISTYGGTIENYNDIGIPQPLLTDPVLGGGTDGGLRKGGNNKLTLSGANTYNGGSIINGGVLEFANAGALPGAGLIIANIGGALQASGPSSTVSAWLASGKIDTTSTGAIALTANEGAISMGSYTTLSLGAVGEVTYTGTLTPTGAVYYLGGGGGTLIMSNTNALITGYSLVVGNGGGGTVVLSANNNYDGGTTLNNGTLAYTNDASIGGASSAITFSGGNLRVPVGTTSMGTHVINWSTFNGGFDVPDATTLTISDNIEGVGHVSKLGGGVLALNGTASTYSGGTNLYGGTLAYATDASIGGASSTITFNGGFLRTPVGTTNMGSHVINWTNFNGGFDVQDGDTLTISNNISGSGSLMKAGGGILVLSGTNTISTTSIYSGIVSIASPTNIGNNINIQGGLLQVTDTTLTPNLNGKTLNSTTFTGGFDVADSGTLTISQDIGGAGAFAKAGGGTLALTGDLTYTGDTSVWAGSLEVGELTASANVNINDNANMSAEKVVTGTLTIGAGAKLTIKALPGSQQLAGGGMHAVPEPSTWIMLSIAALGLLGAAWRRRNS
jgi:fibronectin-binding autotransporter adhesin